MALILPMGDQGLGGWDCRGDPLPGYPIRNGHGVVQRPAHANGVGAEPLVAWADDGGNLHLTDLAGVEQPGWPVDLGARPVTGVTSCDLDADGFRELAVGTSDARVHLLSADGDYIAGWPLELSEELLWQPVQITLGGERGRGLVLSLANSRLTVVGTDGHQLPGWPLQVGFPAGTAPVTADINSDGLTDVVFATQNRRLLAVDARGKALDDWPFMLDERAVRGAAALGVVDRAVPRPQVALSTRDSVVYLVNADATLAGTWRWPNRPGATATQPIIAIDGGCVAVVVGCDDGTIHAWDAEGAGIEGYPIDHGERIVHSPASGDINGDGVPELAAVGVSGKLAVYSLAPSSQPSGPWPQPLSDSHNTGSYGISFLPVASVGQVVGEQTGDVAVAYRIESGTETGIAVAYSTDAGYSWTGTSGYSLTSGGLIWRSAEDLPAQDRPDCMIRVTPFSSRGPGVAGTTPVFRVDNNQPPVVYLNSPEKLDQGRWRIAYAVEDREGDTIQLQAQYSTDGGSSWSAARLAGATVEIEPWLYGEPVTFSLPSTMQELPAEEISLRVRAADQDPGPWQTIGTLAESVGRPPSGQILAPESEVGGRVQLGVRLSNPEGNPLEMSYEYSVDGGSSWKPATVTEPEEGAPSTYEFEVVWHSEVDEPFADYSGVRFRAVPEDVGRGVAVPSSPFHLDNNRPPSVEVRSPGSWDRFHGLVPISLSLSDYEGDSLTVGLEYRLTDGGSWRRARGIVSGGPFAQASYTSTVHWNSSVELPGVSSQELELRVTVFDGDTVRSETLGPIVVENRRLPSFMQACVSSHDALAASAEITFELSDPEGRSLGIRADYSLDGGSSWNRARVSGDLGGLIRGDYGGRLTWNYRSDLGDSGAFALLRLTPTFGDNAGEPRLIELAVGG